LLLAVSLAAGLCTKPLGGEAGQGLPVLGPLVGLTVTVGRPSQCPGAMQLPALLLRQGDAGFAGAGKGIHQGRMGTFVLQTSCET